ncbi:FAD-dependent oxidoreductase [Methylocucumis oryzae]|uniref:FAD-dependent oxidoreductase n=1 Tax=Methylocucumis oryzae TaxID=1632867 RepID=UPI000AC606B4|nr:FAD-dependent oxidoreductase [Methylocucumis oryzae]
MYELGFLDEFLKLPHQALNKINACINETITPIADLTALPTQCKFIAFMPQWDFLNFIAEQAKKYPSFQLCMATEATGLVETNGVITGVTAKTATADITVSADLVIAADGRFSTVRDLAGMHVTDKGVPIDVLWLRLSKQATDVSATLGRIRGNRMMIMIDRGQYWQCGVIIAKNGLNELKQQGLAAFRAYLVALAPFLIDRVDEITDWEQVKLLTVQINHLKHWHRPGLLCIGDAAHAMSPAGGVGVNLAIQDAIATANLLAEKLRTDATINESDLHRVQQRREWPMRVIQNLQAFIHKRIGLGSLETKQTSLPMPVKLLRHWPLLQRLPARVIGIGLRPEHIQTKDAWHTS